MLLGHARASEDKISKTDYSRAFFYFFFFCVWRTTPDVYAAARRYASLLTYPKLLLSLHLSLFLTRGATANNHDLPFHPTRSHIALPLAYGMSIRNGSRNKTHNITP